MNKEQLLEKAKKDYPVGTKVDQRTAYGGAGQVIKITSHSNIYLDEGTLAIGGIGVYNPVRKLWAKIISKPEVVETTKVDTFVLPERWYIQSNSKIDNILIDWRGGGHTTPANNAILLSDRYWIFSNRITLDYPNHIEITFDQFKKYVLKENVEIKPEIVDTSVYTLKQIEAALYKFDKEDIKDILDAVKKHK